MELTSGTRKKSFVVFARSALATKQPDNLSNAKNLHMINSLGGLLKGL